RLRWRMQLAWLAAQRDHKNCCSEVMFYYKVGQAPSSGRNTGASAAGAGGPAPQTAVSAAYG
ncbi:hypothetical protein HispidOSU_012593, partial [Sigmodon hispidus]